MDVPFKRTGICNLRPRLEGRRFALSASAALADTHTLCTQDAAPSELGMKRLHLASLQETAIWLASAASHSESPFSCPSRLPHR